MSASSDQIAAISQTLAESMTHLRERYVYVITRAGVLLHPGVSLYLYPAAGECFSVGEGATFCCLRVKWSY